MHLWEPIWDKLFTNRSIGLHTQLGLPLLLQNCITQFQSEEWGSVDSKTVYEVHNIGSCVYGHGLLKGIDLHAQVTRVLTYTWRASDSNVCQLVCSSPWFLSRLNIVPSRLHTCFHDLILCKTAIFALNSQPDTSSLLHEPSEGPSSLSDQPKYDIVILFLCSLSHTWQSQTL